MSTASSEITVPGWYIEFQVALLRQAPRPGDIDQVTAEGWVNTQRVLKEDLAGLLIPFQQPTKRESELEFIDNIEIPATSTPFYAKERFVVGTGPDAEIPIVEMDADFMQWFLSGDKNEGPKDKTVVSCSRLKESLWDIALINEIGGQDLSELLMTEMFMIMKIRHSIWKEERRLKNFYVRDGFGTLRAVQWEWQKMGWSIVAFPIGVEMQCTVYDLVFHHSRAF
jgi:hypothetical protein